ncbi:MAG: hypothetical protein RL196_1134 [Actinomycetota bacterium]|jgi:hypothetical protein
MKNEFYVADKESAVDLQGYLTRARRLDPEGSVRFRAFGNVLATYVAPIFAGSLMDSGPTVLGLRTCVMPDSIELDSTVPIAAVLERLARILGGTIKNQKDLKVDLPPSQRVSWAGILPPRTGWVAAEGERAFIAEPILTQLAKDGIAEVAENLPASVGGPIAARIRGEVWGRAIGFESPVPMGAAFVAAGLGFLTENEQVGVYLSDGWARLSSSNGHVLAKIARHH